MNNNIMLRLTYMTLIMGVKAKDGLILASDTRNFVGVKENGELGGEYNDWAVKIFKINKHVCVGIAGLPAITRAAIDDLIQASHENDDIKEVSNKLVAISRTKALITIGIPQAAYIIAGYKRDSKLDVYNEKEIYGYTHSSPIPSPYDAYYCEGVKEIANYTLNRFYSRNKTVDELLPLVVYAIHETAKVDATVGKKVNILQFKDDGSFKEFSPIEVKKIADEVERKTNKIYAEFWQTK